MVLPQVTVNAAPPFTWGGTFGTVGFAGDTFWLSNPVPGWSTVYNHMDNVMGNYFTGIEFFDLNYRNANIVPPPPHNYYIKEVLIPWVAFQLSDGNWYRYGHNDDPINGGNMNGNLMFIGGPGGFGYTESPFQPGMPTTLWARYVLDMNGDGLIDWIFDETIILQGDFFGGGIWPGGQGSISIAPIFWPPGPWIQMVPGGPWLQFWQIEYGFILDADVGAPFAGNDIFSWNGFNWARIANEQAIGINPDPNGDIGMIQDPNSGLNVKIRPMFNAVGWQFFQFCWAQVYNPMGEYSQFPVIYQNGQGTINADVLFWYVEDINIAGNFWPPPVTPEGLYFEDLQ
jgi:hypothetical protein